jgi:hypothetical protein
MRQRALQLSCAILVALAASASAAPMAPPGGATRADAAILPQVGPASSPNARLQGDELRECAGLVLVGSMLIGVAAAVRRTV